MTQQKNIWFFIINTLMGGLIILGTALYMQEWSWFVQMVLYTLATIGIISGLILLLIKKEALLKTLFVFFVFITITLLSFIIMNEVAHLDYYATDIEKISFIVKMIQDTGSWGIIVYVLLQIFMVIISPIPAWIFYVAGAQIWGPAITTLFGSLGVFIGSLIAYWIGYVFGHKVVVWIVGKDLTDKYAPILAHKGKGLFVMMQIFPFFPDDILCMIAGMTNMNFAFFVTVMIFVRSAVVAVYSYGGSGKLIPFSGWGIPVWILLFILFFILALVYWKYQDKFESWLEKKFLRKRRKNQDD